MSINKKQSTAFLNRELKNRADARGFTVLPEQAQVNQAEANKVRLKNAPNRP